jgi:hypothetical protein
MICYGAVAVAVAAGSHHTTMMGLVSLLGQIDAVPADNTLFGIEARQDANQSTDSGQSGLSSCSPISAAQRLQ